MTMLNLTSLKTGKLWLKIILVLFAVKVNAQNLLDKSISIEAKKSKLSVVLKEISQKGGFYFAYNGKLLPQDSMISIVSKDQRIAVILSQLFKDKYAFEERNNYVIITLALRRLSIINTDLTKDGDTYSLSGLVADDHSGERLMNVSVYEKQQLVSALTDEHGYFKLKFKMSAPAPIAVTAGKQFYRDTTLNFLETVVVKSRSYKSAYSNAADKTNRVEGTGLGQFFISTRQMIQSMNIPNFFASRPFQVSLTPGLSTQGMFSPQVVNKFSLNLAGGYTAGVNGLEVGGLFNINKRNTRYLQIAGIFNLVGGNATGLQLAGVHNRALDTVRGAQLALFTNQASTQLSGFQFSLLHNQTHRLKGLQVGLVNVADTSHGASIGLLNFIGNGFYKVTYSAGDLSNTNFSLKTGTHSFYSEMLFSANASANEKFYSFGLGVGHDFMFSDKVYLSAEANYQLANTGLWDDRWTQGKLLLSVQLAKEISLFGGATFNHYNHKGIWHQAGYKNVTNLPEFGILSDHPDYSDGYGQQSKNWIGWQFGIAFNSVFKPTKRVIDNSHAWYLGIATTGGIAWDDPYGIVTGAEIAVQRELGEKLIGTLSSGYTHFSIQNKYSFENSGNIYNSYLPVNIVPVKAGIRLKTRNDFFIAGELGAGVGSEAYMSGLPGLSNGTVSRPYRSFMYTISAGFNFKNGLETGIKFEDYGLQSNYKQFAFRLGYLIKLSK